MHCQRSLVRIPAGPNLLLVGPPGTLLQNMPNPFRKVFVAGNLKIHRFGCVSYFKNAAKPERKRDSLSLNPVNYNVLKLKHRCCFQAPVGPNHCILRDSASKNHQKMRISAPGAEDPKKPQKRRTPRKPAGLTYVDTAHTLAHTCSHVCLKTYICMCTTLYLYLHSRALCLCYLLPEKTLLLPG